MKTNIIIADLNDPFHAQAIIALLEAFALDPMGGNQALTVFTKENLIAALKQRRAIRTMIAFVDGVPAGLAICLEGFSTFSCKPLLNIHDLVVAPAFRGEGIGRQIIEKVISLANHLGCCKVTLEVLEGNTRASGLYRSCGFVGYDLNPEMGKAMFLQHTL
ncbi:GNAT family N-acetyltransferase [Glaciimonas immobilis]|uniref:Ribosomal protein S18 acetylase RimI-like enzyme n=1 Tax=Glaciimonas immobilis TaxID=728004 RepID=A0A840RQH0_9BURK|nr:GNAT family N-acetyltransferase [Glaciimonas immobilis]KAF3998064.1 GNAT family N-acetyltransferase [Glaciimonas immobilis]MBB5199246.1 ribosomal protein S18 acetylase RimI-like enzyme [Glaciimonas immobilis]